MESPDPPDEKAPLTDPDVVVLGVEDGPDVARFDSETGDMEVTDAVVVGDVLVSDPIKGIAPYGIAQVVESVNQALQRPPGPDRSHGAGPVSVRASRRQGRH